MFGLSEAHYNIVKRKASDCGSSISALVKKGEKYDRIAAAEIDKAHAPVATIITRLQFVWLIGYLNGRFGNDSTDYE